ncbi:hypothetical protein ABNQ39_20485 [Azospirillum sp. A26]|uniref:hypothetical protein n=1 Tax=Azospirillum sp. A26 TaxID=3160607 RepID=UPI00366C7D0A
MTADLIAELKAIDDAAGIGTLCRVTDVRYQPGTANQMAGYLITWENGAVTLVGAESDAQRFAAAQQCGQPVPVEGHVYYVPAALKGEAQP